MWQNTFSKGNANLVNSERPSSPCPLKQKAHCWLWPLKTCHLNLTPKASLASSSSSKSKRWSCQGQNCSRVMISFNKRRSQWIQLYMSGNHPGWPFHTEVPAAKRWKVSQKVIILTWMAATRSAHLSVYQMNLIPAGHKTRQELKNS